ncbi:GNAT family N-acetyltransferase [Bosea sp. BH3]|uniref:GNAT family N-acetyltransferase n=1 Tax=Bosea sp. BH3 TaxID=2871701 RepID=UPI0021CB1DC1|nr:GNAT family N-acetyltransferase [Bosea sp. BH3]MCU4181357.1 GNAT family N-acetyltransferase [Bosea sp. BH3]
MTAKDEITIAQLDEAGARAAIPALCGILADAVASGASVGFMADAAAAEYERFWEGVVAEVAAGRTVLFAASLAGRIVATTQIQLIGKPNQPHRAEIAKVLVHSQARRRGIASRLMQAAEAEALRRGRNLLVLDTDGASAAHALYTSLGFVEVGTIPRYALMPDGADCGATFFYKDLR